ncbi:hypothetical protein Aazo_5357 (plasmid) ['Nostoc azollae' 0708]|uniref:Uncharacterized protein n=1 Tax=Nostoc azollae (strain 0708) TaxID=551115 RepID=D7E5R0_NOSA0|nr:hypothetical protein Aazo_5357 ['Nostoc azollae' 0708]
MTLISCMVFKLGGNQQPILTNGTSEELDLKCSRD